MPELPEVEVTTRALTPKIKGRTVSKVVLRRDNLRWPIPSEIKSLLPGQKIESISRRAKYIVIGFTVGNLILHLGMSGCLRVVDASVAPVKHDHVDIEFSDGSILRLNDPRRFGAVLFTPKELSEHPRLVNLGVEPLSKNFNASYLFDKVKNSNVAIKTFLMNANIVVGIGNIYAQEVLFKVKISPLKSARLLSLSECQLIVRAVKQILKLAIKSGGTTLKDFYSADGKPGYFKQQLSVYGRENQACSVCATMLVACKQVGRKTVYCPSCQSE